MIWMHTDAETQQNTIFRKPKTLDLWGVETFEQTPSPRLGSNDVFKEKRSYEATKSTHNTYTTFPILLGT